MQFQAIIHFEATDETDASNQMSSWKIAPNAELVSCVALNSNDVPDTPWTADGSGTLTPPA